MFIFLLNNDFKKSDDNIKYLGIEIIIKGEFFILVDLGVDIVIFNLLRQSLNELNYILH